MSISVESYVYERNCIVQFCQSNGKYVTWTETQAHVAGDGQEKPRSTREGLGFESFDADLHSTRAAVECGRRPGYPAVAVNLNVHMQGHIEHTVVAANNDGEEHEFKEKRILFPCSA